MAAGPEPTPDPEERRIDRALAPVPLGPKIALLTGTAAGMVASIVLSYAGSPRSTAALLVGVGAGVAGATFLWWRGHRNG